MGPGHSQSVFEPSRIGHAVGIHKSDIFSTRSAYSQISSRVGAGAFLDKQSHALTALRDGEAFIQGAIIHQDYLIRSEEHTSELQSLMRISYAVFCLKKKTDNTHKKDNSLKTNQ